MSSETIEVKKREGVGSAASRRLRQQGHVPANLYGHGEENVNLTVKADAINRVIQHGTKLLSLTGDIKDTALLREVQWDAFGIDVLHVDFTRVSQSESVEVSLPVEMHGEAPGLSQGGQLNFALHELTIKCPASSIPDHLEANVGSLNIGEAVHASDIALPDGAEMVNAANDVVIQINKPSGAAASEEAADELGAEPEVISKGAGEEDAEG